MLLLHLTVLTTSNETSFCQNDLPSFKSQIFCLQCQTSFLSSWQTKYCASLATRTYFYTSFPFRTWLSHLYCTLWKFCYTNNTCKQHHRGLGDGTSSAPRFLRFLSKNNAT